MLTKPYDIVDVRNEDMLSYNSEGVAKLASSEDAAVWLARLLPGQQVAPHVHEDTEDNALVVTGFSWQWR